MNKGITGRSKKTEKEILRQQLELLAEQSKSACEDEIPKNTHAMVEIYKELKIRSLLLLAFFFVVIVNFIIHIIILIKKLRRG